MVANLSEHIFYAMFNILFRELFCYILTGLNFLHFYNTKLEYQTTLVLTL